MYMIVQCTKIKKDPLSYFYLLQMTKTVTQSSKD